MNFLANTHGLALKSIPFDPIVLLDETELVLVIIFEAMVPA